MPFFLYGECPRCAVPISRPVRVLQIGALPCGFHASSATGGAWSPPHEQERTGYHDGRAFDGGAEAAGRAAHCHRRRGRKGRLRSYHILCNHKKKGRIALLFIWGYFALRGENGLRRPTFPISWKSGQKSQQEPKVPAPPCALHDMQVETAYRTFTEDSSFRFVIESSLHQRRCR